jgi:hypothetical protein
MRAMMPKRSIQGERKGWEEKGGRNNGCYGFNNKSGGSGSDSRSWRKEVGSGVGSMNSEKDDEATSALKKLQETCVKGNQKKLTFHEENDGRKVTDLVAIEVVAGVVNEMASDKMELGGEEGAGEATEIVNGQGRVHVRENVNNKGEEDAGNKGRIIKKFKAKGREGSGKQLDGVHSKPPVRVGAKCGAELMDTEEQNGKEGKLRSLDTVVEVGLLE